LSNALILSASLGVATAIGVICLYRKGKLKEDHAIFWLFISIIIIALSTFQDLSIVLASFIFLLILVSIYYSVTISELIEQNKKLAQELAMLTIHKKENKNNKDKETSARAKLTFS